MTATVTIPGSKFYIAIETSPGSGVYTTPCVFMSKAMDSTANVVSDTEPQCDAPTSPALVRKIVDSVEYQFSGSGKLAETSLRFWREWLRSGLARGIRIYENDQSHAHDGGYDSGQAVLSKFRQNQERPKSNEFDITIDIDGALTWVDNA